APLDHGRLGRRRAPPRGRGALHRPLRLRRRGRRRGGLAEVEAADRLRQAAGLLLQRAGRGGRLLHQRGVLLRDLVHLRDGLADLLDALALLLAGRADLGHDVGDALHAGHDLVHGLAGLLHQHGAVADFLHRVVDQGLDLLGGAGRALRQAAHLGRDHGEAAALFAGARRLHRGVERQDVGLEGDAVDDADDVDDLLRRVVDRRHGGDHLAHHVAALGGDIAGADRQLVGLAGALGVLLHGAGQLLHRRGGLLQRGGLLLGARRQVVVAGGDLARRGADQVGRLLDLADDAGQLHDGAVGVVLELAERALVVAGHLLREVAAGQGGEHAGHVVQALAAGLQQLVDAVGQLAEEAVLAVDADAPAEVAVGRRLHDAADLGLHRDLGGAVEPLDHRAQALALRIDDRVHGQREDAAADLDLRAVGVPQVFQHALLVLGIAVELVDRAAHDAAQVEARQVAAQVGLGLAQHLHDRLVDVHDLAVVVGDHDVGGDVVEGVADAQVLVGGALLALGRGQFRRHVLPFDDDAQALAAAADDRVENQVEGAAADLQRGLVGMAELVEQPALVGRVLVEHVDVGAQHLGGGEARQVLADVGFGLGQHLPDGIVEVDDVVIAVGDHDVGRHHVEALLDAGGFGGLAPFALGGGQLGGHVLPLDHIAEAAADGELGVVGGLQPGQQAALVGRILVEAVDVGADHAAGFERGDILLDVG